MAETQRRNKEREFADLNRDFQRKQREFREDLNQRRNEELAQVDRAGEPRHPPDRRAGEVRHHLPGSRVREPAHRHHREGDQGAGRQAAVEMAMAGPLTLARDRGAPRRRASPATPRAADRPGRLAGERGPRRRSLFSPIRSYTAQLAATRAGGRDPRRRRRRGLTALPRIVCDNPYAYFARVSQLFNPRCTGPARRRASDARVVAAPIARRLGRGVFDRRRLHGRRGRRDRRRDAACYPGVVVYPGCRIGARCILHSGVVIGADGFGIARTTRPLGEDPADRRRAHRRRRRDRRQHHHRPRRDRRHRDRATA